VSRAKLLFDFSQEHDKLVLVHSALLLSFWFADTEDVMQSWYWTSIAFGIAQPLGLHTPGPMSGQNHARLRSGRITWQCCMVRGVWLAFGMGRPLRIMTLDSAMCSEGMDFQLTDLTFKDRKLYSTDEALALQSMWRSLVDTTNVLRNIMTSNTLPSVTTASLHSPTDVRDPGTSALTTHVGRQLKLHQLTAATALARARNEQKEL
jgi:hypothetical protein